MTLCYACAAVYCLIKIFQKRVRVRLKYVLMWLRIVYVWRWRTYLFIHNRARTRIPESIIIFAN